MKKLFTFIAAASIFAACNTKSDLDTKKDVVVIDTSSMYKSNASTDISSAQINPAPAPQQAQPATQIRTIIHERTVYINRTPRSTRQVIHEVAQTEPVIANVPQAQPQAGNGTQTSQASGPGNVTGTTAGSATPAATPSEKKKGWSNAAKDAVIGGSVGAVGGAIFSKNKVKGAVIGGIIGAAGGYIFGHKKDKATTDNNANYAKY